MGPLNPKRIDTWPDARLISADGMKKGLTRHGPRSCNVTDASKIPCRPPMPEPIITPVRSRDTASRGFQPESSTAFNDQPERASRPYDRDRDGFVMGEGCGLVVLEELGHAKARGAKIYAELTGYGLSGDAHHITAPSEDGDGGYRCMQMALKRAKLVPADIDYVNAHGTSTPKGDEIELGAVKRLFGEDAYKLSMSSTKSAVGHLLGAAGSVEAIFSVLAICDQVAPPTLNLEDPSDGCDIDLVPLKAKKRPIRHALSNSFGFGGTNASLVFSAVG